MRLAVIGMLMVACGQFGSLEAIQVTASPSNVGAGPADPLPLPSNPVGPSSPISADVWFALDPALEAKYPAARELTSEAFERWGWRVGFDPTSPNRLRLGALSGNPDGTHAAAVHRPALVDGERRSAAQGGYSEIVVSESALLSELSAEGCSAAWREGEPMPALLVRVLTHEVGHMLGVPDDRKDYDAAMYFSARYCTDLWPSEGELRAAHAAD